MNEDCAPSDPELALADVAWVRVLARSLVRDRHSAEDLAQETWLAALRAGDRARLGARAWLGGIARHLARRRLRRPEPRAAGLLDELGARAATPGELLAQADFQRRVLAEVTALDEPYRTTVLLRYFEGLSVEELSARMGMPGSTGRTRLQRAHGMLRERLDREYGARGTWCALAGAAPTASLAWKGLGIVGTQMRVVLGCGAAAVVGWAAWWGVREVPAHSTRAGEVNRVALVEPIAVAPREPEAIAAEEGVQREALPASPETPTAPAGTLDESEVARMVFERLRLVLERSVGERIDPNAILDAALFLVQREASDRAIPEPSPSGWMAFPILDLPEGIEAELQVAPPSSDPNFAHVLCLEMRLPKADGAYLVDGMPRRGALARATIWADPEDQLLHFSIMTELDADAREARRRGLLEDLTFTSNLHYYLDLGDPNKTGIRMSGIEHGRGPAKRDVPLALDGGPPRRDAIDRFGKRLLAMYAGIRHSSGR